jgi:hypothetical protein
MSYKYWVVRIRATNGDMAILVSFIMGEFRNVITISQCTWRSSKSVSIGTLGTEMRYGRIDNNDIQISYVQFGPVVIKIQLVVLSSPQ